ncbi:MAG: hypothetical protein QOG46_110 [Pseudonocardiales bacterium]|nr:hypothetical protein [Pseudonocardiales bacterium]
MKSAQTSTALSWLMAWTRDLTAARVGTARKFAGSWTRYVKIAGWLGVSISGDRPVQSGYRRDGLFRRNLAATSRFFAGVLADGSRPAEVTTRQAAHPRMIEEGAWLPCHTVFHALTDDERIA